MPACCRRQTINKEKSVNQNFSVEKLVIHEDAEDLLSRALRCVLILPNINM